MIRRVALFVALLACEALAAPSMSVDGHALAIHADGTVRAWGGDDNGKLGTGRALTLAQPHTVGAMPPGGFVSISANETHVVAVTANGEVWAWGANRLGQLGDLSGERSLPGRVAGLPRMVLAQAGFLHTVALDSEGAIWTWGDYTSGALGGGAQSVEPRRLAGLPRMSRVWAGYGRSFATAEDGAFYAWGSGFTGARADFTPVVVPTIVPALRNVVSVGDGGLHVVAVTGDGAAWSWGDNLYGALGHGTSGGPPVFLPTRVNGIDGVAQVAAGWSHTIALKSDGTVHSWGDSENGELGTGSRTNRYSPGPVAGLAGVTSLAAGSFHTLARIGDGSVWAWGANFACELGGCQDEARLAPTRVSGLAPSVSVAAAFMYSVALDAAGGVHTWGLNAYGQLGNNDAIARSAPVPIEGISGAVSVAAGYWHSLAARSDGAVVAWGATDKGQGGTYGPQPLARPTSTPGIAGLRNIVAVGAGLSHSVALSSDGRVFTWGTNFDGVLGATVGARTTAAPVTGVEGATAIAVAELHNLALRSDGTVLAWGSNGFGQLGFANVAAREFPVAVPGLTDVVAIAARGQASMALKRDGSVWTWGGNEAGVFGDGTRTGSHIPKRVPNLPPVVAISLGSSSAAAVTAQGTLWAWGLGVFGQQGDGGSADAISLPHEVQGVTDAVQVAVGRASMHVIRRDGTVLAWGYNADGRLGDGTFANRSRPVATVRENGAGTIEAGDWFLRLAAGGNAAPVEAPAFGLLARTTPAGVDATLRPRAQDAGSATNVYVFALAPADIVRPAADGSAPTPLMKARGKSAKAGEVACVLAQLDAAGQLQAVSAAQLQAYVSGVLAAQGQAVSVLNGVPSANIGGATFYIGYGGSGSTMIANGLNRSAVTVPGERTCVPQAPQTGWWWNSAEPGRGFAIETRGNRLFYAAFHYDTEGRATWHFAGGPTSLDGSLFTADFTAASGGQTLTGPYRPPSFASAGTLTMAFSDAGHGTMSWPGGITPIERLPFVPNGLTAPAQAGPPEAGWWWNPQESGRGFFIEWQNGYFHVAAFLYEPTGRPTWYLSAYPSPDPLRINGSWWLFGGGQAPGAPPRPATRIDENVAPVDIRFTSPTTATMILPGGASVPLVRMAF